MTSTPSIENINHLLRHFMSTVGQKSKTKYDIKNVKPPTMTWVGQPCPQHFVINSGDQGLFSSLSGCNAKLWELFKFAVPPFPAPHFFNLTFDDTIEPDNSMCVALNYVFWIDYFGMAVLNGIYKNQMDVVTSSKKGNSKKVKTWNEMVDATLKAIKMIFCGEYVEKLEPHNICQDVEKFLLDPCMLCQLPWKPILLNQWLLAALSLVLSFELQSLHLLHWPLSEEALSLANNLLSSVCKLKECIMLGFGIVTEHVIAYPIVCDDKYADVVLDVVVLRSIPMLELLLNGSVHHMILKIKKSSWIDVDPNTETAYISVDSYSMLPSLASFNANFAYNFHMWTLDYIPNLFPKLNKEVMALAAKLCPVKSTHAAEVCVVKPLSINEKYLLLLTERAFKTTSSEERIKITLRVIKKFVLIALPGLKVDDISRKLSSAKSKKQAAEIFDKIKPELMHHAVRHALMYQQMYKMLINFEQHNSIAGQIIFKQMFILEQEQVIRLTNICGLIFQIKPVLAQTLEINFPPKPAENSKAEAETSTTLANPEVNIDQILPNTPNNKLEEPVLSNLDTKPVPIACKVEASLQINSKIESFVSTWESKLAKEALLTDVNSSEIPVTSEALNNCEINSKVTTNKKELNLEASMSESAETSNNRKTDSKAVTCGEEVDSVATLKSEEKSEEWDTELSSSKENDTSPNRRQRIPAMSSKHRQYLPSNSLLDVSMEEMILYLQLLPCNVRSRAATWARFDSVWQEPVDETKEVPGTVQHINDVIHILLDKIGRILYNMASKKFTKRQPFFPWTMLQFVLPSMIRGLREDPTVLNQAQDFCFFPLVASTVQSFEVLYLNYLTMPDDNKKIRHVRHRKNKTVDFMFRQYGEWSVINKKMTSDINTVVRLIFTFTSGKSRRFHDKFKYFCKFAWNNFDALYFHGSIPFRQVFDCFFEWHSHIYLQLIRFTDICIDDYVICKPGDPMPTYPKLGELYLACEVVMELGVLCHMSASYARRDNPVPIELHDVDFRFRTLILTQVMVEHRQLRKDVDRPTLQMNYDTLTTAVYEMYQIVKKYRQGSDQITTTLMNYLPISDLYSEVKDAVKLFFEGKLDELELLIPIFRGPQPVLFETKQSNVCRNCGKMEADDIHHNFVVCETCIEDQYPDVNYYCGKQCKEAWWKIEHMAEHLEFDLGLSDFSHLKLNDEPNTSQANAKHAIKKSLVDNVDDNVARDTESNEEHSKDD